MKENLKIVRKQFMFLLNYALDILKKNNIDSDDLVYFQSKLKNLMNG